MTVALLAGASETQQRAFLWAEAASETGGGWAREAEAQEFVDV